MLTISHEHNPFIANYTLGQEQLSAVDSYPHLRVTISSDLRWHKHVDRHNVYRCPLHVKTLAYTSLIRPHLEFASAAWDPYTARDSNQLDKLRHRAELRVLYKMITAEQHPCLV